MKQKPTLSFWQIWNLSFGFLGIQIGYSLQSSQTSRILSALGADLSHLSYYWLAAPIAGLIVQPIIGMSSDRTWGRFGRRIPFILGGAIVSALAMFFMPNSEFVAHIMPPVIFGAFMLLFMDCAFNVSMQPFRSLVGDMVNDKQRNLGYSVQSLLTNIGSVVGYLLPFILTTVFLIRNEPLVNGVNEVVPSVKWAYTLGGIFLLLTVLWTTFRVKEYPPKLYDEYNNITIEEKEKKSFIQILKSTPTTMLQLGVVQFFSWFALFLLWVYAVDGIAENIWHTGKNTAEYNEAGNWNGVLGAVYGAVAAIFSMFMARIATKFGRKKVYSMALLLGAFGLASMFFIQDKYMLIFSMVGVGVAWAGILAMPYAILSSVLPASKMGVYMGIFNATITIPQIVAGLTGSLILKYIAGDSPITMLLVAGVSMLLASLSVVFVRDSDEILIPGTEK
ncbi:maltose/moltooligosaccharide transporter [Dysgonomonas hofstadii]|uniref:Maltose/moltooligosaccharide transporter n=1 Tax=Dysgonomonas hofstadii TaxID=637886 RepID=A0A840CTS6_9BACT|nr:MFS transporter [Dysgonomonas hofstadii]MBB4036255.1 maltose/moltooligosaccharide transporter [Dysgonomonas hofstadii]